MIHAILEFPDSEPPRVVLLWDGETLYDDVLPVMPPTSFTHPFPFCLFEITTNPGKHVLEARCGDKSQTVEFEVRENEEQHFYLHPDGSWKDESFLLEDIGPDPMFM